MAHSLSAQKRVRQNEAARARNRWRLRTMRDAIKDFGDKILHGSAADAAAAAFRNRRRDWSADLIVDMHSSLTFRALDERLNRYQNSRLAALQVDIIHYPERARGDPGCGILRAGLLTGPLAVLRLLVDAGAWPIRWMTRKFDAER